MASGSNVDCVVRQVREVIAEYAQKGIYLHKFPRIKHVPVHKGVTACVPLEAENLRSAAVEKLTEGLGNYFRDFGFQPSNRALKEAVFAVYRPVLEQYRALQREFEGHDLIVTDSFFEDDESGRKYSLYHEVWHLIEQEQDVARDRLSEATAVLASFYMEMEGDRRLIGKTVARYKKLVKAERKKGSSAGFRYTDAAFILYDAAKHEKNLLHSFLDASKREPVNRICEKLMKEVRDGKKNVSQDDDILDESIFDLFEENEAYLASIEQECFEDAVSQVF